MRLTMQERKTVTKALAEQYRRACKREKDGSWSSFWNRPGYDGTIRPWLLRHHGNGWSSAGRSVGGYGRVVGRGPVRKWTYGEPVVQALKKLWEMLDYLTGQEAGAGVGASWFRAWCVP